MGMVERLGERKMPLLLHPDAFLERKVIFPDGHEINLPPPDRRILSQGFGRVAAGNGDQRRKTVLGYHAAQRDRQD